MSLRSNKSLSLGPVPIIIIILRAQSYNPVFLRGRPANEFHSTGLPWTIQSSGERDRCREYYIIARDDCTRTRSIRFRTKRPCPLRLVLLPIVSAGEKKSQYVLSYYINIRVKYVSNWSLICFALQWFHRSNILLHFHLGFNTSIESRNNTRAVLGTT